MSEWIKAQIKSNGAVTTAQFMEWALYHPVYGYYSKGPDIGPRGDFTTSPEASPAFGKLLERHVTEVAALLGHPDRFEIVECGPGRGTLAVDLLDELKRSNLELYDKLCYRLIEISPALVAEQKARLSHHKDKIEWSASVSDLPEGTRGALIANEFVDAFPVHVLVNHNGELCEQYVDIEQDALSFVYRPTSSPRLTDFIQQWQITLEPGETIEVNLASTDWARQLAHTGFRGVGLIIDYGDMSPGRYSSSRKEGTLLGYFGGSVTDSILSRPGQQDLTALVDFTALGDALSECGARVIAITRQASFLIGLGLETILEKQELKGDLARALEFRRGVQALVSMEGLGRFHVLVFSMGLDPMRVQTGLSGLRYHGIL